MSFTFKKAPRTTSDTVTVTRDGQAVVDVKKLFNKPEFKARLKAMRNKVVYVKRAPLRVNA